MKTLFWLWIVYGHSGSFFPAPFQSTEDCEAVFQHITTQRPAIRSDDVLLGTTMVSRHQCIAVQVYYP